ncbi:PQQ-dependent sugar dehydrogenase [Pseudoruegeria sp. HB172150]|uniref:PQQ-dependent sugar dehydrogenase n=1 Tax=Pseudoruegeria sp. HB172150 TaxID=2721164 RepID=UPI0015524893|nr:PQQ-dependent sugar dehydrogenase [Pseudoruegeria sp. HB172150]
MFPRLAFALAATLAAPAVAQDFSWGQRNTTLAPALDNQFRAELVTSDLTLERETVAEGLDHPWGIEILPDGGFLVTERSGQLRRIAADGTVSDPIAGVPEVLSMRQGGLLDVALAPDFDSSRIVYLTYSKPFDDGTTATAAARGTLSDDFTELTNVEDIFVQDPPVPSPLHFGSRIAFDGDGHLYITTGEHSFPQFAVYAQDLLKSFGKVMRLNLDGTVPTDNPFTGNYDALGGIWSYGHRNIQGAYFWEGQLWTIEHGPKGGDELNTPLPGLNYGWPVVSYGENYNGSPVGDGVASADGLEEPVYFWDPVIAPAGMHPYEGEMFPEWQGDLLISSLKPGGVVRLQIEDGKVMAEERLLHGFARVRDIEIDGDGAILIITDEDNGRLIRLTRS